MKGLFVKDFELMKEQKNAYLLIIAIALVMTIWSKENYFAIGFLGLIGSLFTLSSISYDEFDNGNAFLFTLPITRKGYVYEKYLFGLTIGICFIIVGMMISLIAVVINHVEMTGIFEQALPMLSMIIIALALMLPIQLKFGGEKGRIILIGIIGVIFFLGMLIKDNLQALNLTEIIQKLSEMSDVTLFLFSLLVAIVALMISLYSSILIMEKKEF